MEKHLPTIALAPASVASLKAELAPVLPLATINSMAVMTVSALKADLQKRVHSFGSLISRAECDGCLKDLALIVPRAGLDDDQIDRMLDLYWGLFRMNGVTKPMLMRANTAYVMAPKKGKPRFFPDPGELFELMADEARDRKKAVAALLRALAIIDGPPPAQVETQEVPDIEARLRALGQSLSAKGGAGRIEAADRDANLPPVLKTSRTESDSAELIAALERKTGKLIATIRKDAA